MSQKKVVFLDRDGTLIVDKIYLNDPNNIEYLPGVFEGLEQLKEAGFHFIVVTNQSGVPRGLVDIDNLHQIHINIREDFKKHGVEFLNFYYAPYLVESNHEMRKPNPGMLQAGINDFDVDVSKSWMVGDRMTDVEAGKRAELQTVFMTGTEDPEESQFDPPTSVANSFSEVVQFILKSQ